MYMQFFGLSQAPFSISPDPRYLFMSERHREALAHLVYGVNSGGGVVLLTGEIGTGKTTVSRCFLEQLPDDCNVAYIFNPKLTVHELLQSVCDEFHIVVPADAGTRDYVDALNRYLLETHALGRNSVLLIDEAQNLSAEVLEQLRLLTNLETNERKLLQIILIGQPELRTLLHRPELTQLAQRVLAHYHLTALSMHETASYIQHRLATAGLAAASPLQQTVMKQIHRLTNGVPRHINLLCDRAMLGAYARGTRDVSRDIVDIAARELFISGSDTSRARNGIRRTRLAVASLLCATVAGAVIWGMNDSAALDEARLRWGELTGMSTAVPASLEALLPEVTAATGTPESPMTGMPTLKTGDPGIVDMALPAELNSEAEAIARLAELWDTPSGVIAGEIACDMTAPLRCYRSQGGMAELRQLDRPAVLVLYDDVQQPQYALLTALGNGKATLGSGKDSRTMDMGELMRRFRGEFITLWRAPEDSSLDGRGAWATSQLIKLDGVNGTKTSPAGTLPESTQLIRRFQRAQGLTVDGVAGPITLMHVNRVAGVEEPYLLNPSLPE